MGRREDCGELTFNGYSGSVGVNEKVLEMDGSDSCRTV